LDCIIVLEKNVDYECVKLDDFLTLLVHDETVVGLKIECIGHITQTLCDAVHSNMDEPPPDSFSFPFPLRHAISFAYLLNEQRNAFDVVLSTAYAKARDYVDGIVYDPYTVVRNSVTKILV
jgi:hypothetical protein